MTGEFADFGLRHFTERKDRAAELLLGQTEQKIGLVLARIGRTLQEPAASGFVEGDASVVSCGNPRSSNLLGYNEQLIKLQVVITEAAGDRCAPGNIFLDERTNHVALETLLVIDHVIRDADLLRHAAGIVDIIERAATSLHGLGHALLPSEAALVPELHGEADDVVSLRAQHG